MREYFTLLVHRRGINMMKPVIVLCSVLFLATCIEATEDGPSPGTEEKEERVGFPLTESMCTTPEPRYHGNVIDIGNSCARMGVTRSNWLRLNDAVTLEDFRGFFKGYCARQTLVRHCLNVTNINMEVCKNEALLKMFKIYRGVIETFLNFGCVEDGEKIGDLWYEISEFIKMEQNIEPAKKCIDRFQTMFMDILTSGIDVSSKLFNVHREIKTFAECVYRFEMNASFRDGTKAFLDAIMNGMKCIHPEDGTFVECVTIVVGMIKISNVCDVRTFGTGMSLYDVLEEDSGTHLMEFLRYEGDDISDNDKVRRHVEIACKSRVDVPYFQKKLRTVSEACLNETEQNEFQLLGEFIIGGYEVACQGDAQRFADVMFEVFRLKRTGNGNAIWDCVDVAISARNVTDEHRSSSKNMRFYHELESFKTCLVNKLHGDQVSVDAATSLIDEMRQSVKCVDPEEGITVTCETLHNKT